MNTLKSTFGALAAGLVLASGCENTTQIIGRGDYNGDSIEDFALGDPATGKIEYINIGKGNNEYTVLEREKTTDRQDWIARVNSKVIFYDSKTEKVYFFDGQGLTEAPKWKGTVQELTRTNHSNTNKTTGVVKRQMLDSYEMNTMTQIPEVEKQ